MKTVSAKVPEQLADRVDDYAEDHDLNRSQAVRSLVEEGLEAETTPDTISLPTVLAAVGLFLWFAAFTEISASPTAGAAGGVLVLVALLTQYRQVTDYFRHLARRIRTDTS